jgi:hypothetical protein
MCDRKHQRESFLKDNSRQAYKTLELMHDDVCCPTNTSSIRGVEYFLIFIDDFAWFLWVYTFKSKDEVFAKLQEFKILLKLNVSQRSSVSSLMGDKNTLVMLFVSLFFFMAYLGFSWK